MMAAQAMQPMTKRIVHDYHLRPMNREETRHYLHTKLAAAGSEYPAFIFPDTVLQGYLAGVRWLPGIVDRIALLALASADTLPVGVSNVEHPALPAGTWTDDGRNEL